MDANRNRRIFTIETNRQRRFLSHRLIVHGLSHNLLSPVMAPERRALQEKDTI